MGKTSSEKRPPARRPPVQGTVRIAPAAERRARRGSEPAEPLERARLQAEVARQRVRIAKEELKRARKRVKEAKREAKRARKQADVARKAWKKARKAHRADAAAHGCREDGARTRPRGPRSRQDSRGPTRLQAQELAPTPPMPAADAKRSADR